MKLVTWNVNSIRQRGERLLAFLARHDPDVVCLQETKVADGDFPAEALRAAGYGAVTLGQKGYNGVAILAKAKLTDVRAGFCDGGDDVQARFLGATVAGVQVFTAYAPNGQSVGSEKYAFKLDWFARLRKYLEREADPARELALGGDFNVAPGDLDVHDPLQWRGEIMCSDAERAALADVERWGLVDSFRAKYPDKVAFTWWDYRMLGFPKNRGLRIDHVLVTRPLLARVQDVAIDRDERKGKGASDHAPVLAQLS
ncbi:MAG TPA: exodeoxyribonuclease III [Myxococcota bacterium]|nr:exodeoxyribonuclease III [Myxococcota bacterium]